MLGAADKISFRKEVLLTEYERLCTEIRSIESSNEKLLGFGFSLISLAAVVGLAQSIEEVFFVLPFAAVGTIAYVTTSYTALYSLSGYKEHLEDLINSLLGERLLLWENLSFYREDGSVSSVLLWIIYLFVALSIWTLSIRVIIEDQSLISGIVMGLCIASLCVMLLFSIRRMQRMKRLIYARAKRLHSESDPSNS